MKPIAFTCTETLPLTPEDIAEQILDVTKWPAFRGYGPIPGIKSAEFETRTRLVVGSRIQSSCSGRTARKTCHSMARVHNGWKCASSTATANRRRRFRSGSAASRWCCRRRCSRETHSRSRWGESTSIATKGVAMKGKQSLLRWHSGRVSGLILAGGDRPDATTFYGEAIPRSFSQSKVGDF